MAFRMYNSAMDRKACLLAFESNVPQFFDETERAAFTSYLDTLADYYAVLLLNERVIGCGGVAIKGETAHLCWGMIHRDYHGQGHGRALLEYRLTYAEKLPQVAAIALATSQHTEAFYVKKGFVTQAVTLDGWAPGLHCIEIVKPVALA